MLSKISGIQYLAESPIGSASERSGLPLEGSQVHFRMDLGQARADGDQPDHRFD